MHFFSLRCVLYRLQKDSPEIANEEGYTPVLPRVKGKVVDI